MEEDRSDEKYWDNRVKTHGNNLDRMVWYSESIREHLAWVHDILRPFQNMSVLDMGCGWGRTAWMFNSAKYLGVDFSQEMVLLARKMNPTYTFEKGDGRTYTPEKKFDIVLMFHMSGAQELVERYKQFANHSVIMVGANDVYIYSVKDFS